MRTTQLLLAAILIPSCYEGPGSLPETDSSDASGSSSSSIGSPSTTTSTSGDFESTGVEPSTTGSTTEVPDLDSGSDESTGEPVADPGIHWVGRYDDADPMAVRLGWSGVGLVVRFEGTGVTVNMDDAGQYFTVVVDSMVQPTLTTTPGAQDYVLASDLPPGEHIVEMYRRTEGSFGPSVVHEVMLDGELLAPPPVSRRIEVIGDSITAGYGNEGVSPCSFSAETENHYLTYGAFAARSVGAEVHTIAWSGKGLVYNFGDNVFEPLPELYDRTIASDEATWGFGWSPDVVVVNLGTNDFSTGNDPSQELFESTYVAFLEHLRAVNPDAFVLVVAPTLFGAEATMVEGYLMNVVAQRQAAGDLDVAFADINVVWTGSGCDGHPTVATHEDMGDRLIEELQLYLGW